MSGKLVVIEGSDSSGKTTQLELLCERLTQEGIPFRKIVFPRYENDSSMLARMYLNGEFGSDPGSVNAYAASIFFAADRYASYVSDWGEFYKNGGLVVCHRYTTANAIHQADKLKEPERSDYLGWLFDFEYKRMGIPAPDTVIFLDMPPETAEALLEKRNEGKVSDIHESNKEYLRECYEVSKLCAKRFGWVSVPCVQNGLLRSREEIHREIYRIINE
jgi:dTMP kinase